MADPHAGPYAAPHDDPAGSNSAGPNSAGANSAGSSSADAPPAAGRRRRRWTTTDLSLIAVFAALIAAFALVPAIPVGAVGVPITLQTLAVLLTGVILGPGRGAAAVGLYLAVGLAGIPIFSGFSGGLGVLAGPSVGYLLAFPLAAAVAGALARLVLRRVTRARFLLLFLACMIASILVIHPLGIIGLMVNAHLDLGAAIATDLVFWPGDVGKNLLAAGIGLSVYKAFPRLLDRANT